MSLIGAFKQMFKTYPDEPLAIDVDVSLCSDKEKRRMTHLVNRLSKSDMGREILETANKGGYKLIFESMMDAYGFCNSEKKVLALNSSSSDEKLIATLCHEARHAGQNMRSSHIDEDNLDVKSNLIFMRALEADAQACSFYACEEMAVKGDLGPKSAFAKTAGDIANAGKKALKENNGVLNHNVLTEAFKGWYNQSGLKDAYEGCYIVEPFQQQLDKLADGEKDLLDFTETVTPQETIKLITVTKNGNYFKDSANVLTTDKFLDVSESTKAQLTSLMTEYKRYGGKDFTPSLNDIPVRSDCFLMKMSGLQLGKNGTYIPPASPFGYDLKNRSR